jgi:hypothetical protein
MRWAGHVAQMGRTGKYILLQGKRPLGRPSCRWVDNNKMEWGDVCWIGLAQDRDRWRALVNSVMNLQVP